MQDPGNKGGSQPKYTPADDKAIVKNPTNPAYEADQANREKQKGGPTPRK